MDDAASVVIARELEERALKLVPKQLVVFKKQHFEESLLLRFIYSGLVSF